MSDSNACFLGAGSTLLEYSILKWTRKRGKTYETNCYLAFLIWMDSCSRSLPMPYYYLFFWPSSCQIQSVGVKTFCCLFVFFKKACLFFSLSWIHTLLLEKGILPSICSWSRMIFAEPLLHCDIFVMLDRVSNWAAPLGIVSLDTGPFFRAKIKRNFSSAMFPEAF